MDGDLHPLATIRAVEPVGPEQVERVRRVGVDPRQARRDRVRDPRRLGELGERRQDDARLAEPADGPLVDGRVDQLALQAQSSHRSLPIAGHRPVDFGSERAAVLRTNSRVSFATTHLRLASDRRPR